jgi:hypothetical protein
MSSQPQSKAGTATASAPIVKTQVKTTHKVVHIKRKPKVVVVRASGAGTAGPQAVPASYTAAAGQRSSAAQRQAVSPVSPRAHEDSQGEPQDRSQGEDGGHETGEQESHGDSQEQELEGND